MVSNVGFNDEQNALYDDLKQRGLISQTFSDFVKSAFHEKIDSIKMDLRGVDLSHKTIEDLTFKSIKKETEKVQD